MKELDFSNLNELYIRVTPALNSKIKELRLMGINYVTKEDLFNYLSKSKWKETKDLTLYDMVDDILNTRNSEIDEYIKKDKLKGK